MRLFLISALLLSLVSGCSSVNIGPHRIDVQQGNALDQENIARLKPGLNRSQVRFLLGTPLVVDPFRTDRWDYVYVNYKAGKLAEQKRITLFFDGETLARIEGDLPAPEPEPVEKPPAPAASSAPKVETSASAGATESKPLPVAPTLQSEPIPSPKADPVPVSVPKPPVQQPVIQAVPVVAAPQALTQTLERTPITTPTTRTSPVQASASTSSIVPPLPSPKNAPVYVDPRPPAELSLQPETNVAQIKSDVVPSFPEPHSGGDKSDKPVLNALNAWANAWMQRDAGAYLAAYDSGFVPQGEGGRADWVKRRRLLFSTAEHIDIKIDSASVDRTEEGAVTVTFNQHYRSDSYSDAVVKQLLMVERDGRWLIVEEKVLSVLRSSKR